MEVMTMTKQWYTFGNLVDAAGVQLTDSEMSTMVWLSQFEQSSISDLISVFNRIRGTNTAAS